VGKLSFCGDIKKELAEMKTRQCCKDALVYGYALFGRSFNAKRICLQTESEAVAYSYGNLLSGVYGVEVSVTRGGGKRPTYIAEVKSEADKLRILASVDFGIYDGSIYRDNFYRECCVQSFVRGAFLACGHLSDPDKDYRADFYIKDKRLAEEFSEILLEHMIESHTSKRGNTYSVYIKKNEMIVNLLAFMGAGGLSLQYLEASVVKSLSNKINRNNNCDSGNIGRTVEASLKQRKAIEFLKEHGRLDTLDGKLIYVAKLRMKYPDASLKELTSKSTEPITVSGLNHRLKKLIELYEELKN